MLLGFARRITVVCFALFWMKTSYAMDSYRYLHVTIETPWAIFLFLLMAVLAPFVLMGILVWRYAERRAERESDSAKGGENADCK